eukprot:GILI01008961.1.p1 GENE.GILI01008961.1~~GILI01008961.1.p1  ORF type:complete len:1429 (-),score=302.14 GILI01008961.1:138-4313(-)
MFPIPSAGPSSSLGIFAPHHHLHSGGSGSGIAAATSYATAADEAAEVYDSNSSIGEVDEEEEQQANGPANGADEEAYSFADEEAEGEWTDLEEDEEAERSESGLRSGASLMEGDRVALAVEDDDGSVVEVISSSGSNSIHSNSALYSFQQRAADTIDIISLSSDEEIAPNTVIVPSSKGIVESPATTPASFATAASSLAPTNKFSFGVSDPAAALALVSSDFVTVPRPQSATNVLPTATGPLAAPQPPTVTPTVTPTVAFSSFVVTSPTTPQPFAPVPAAACTPTIFSTAPVSGKSQLITSAFSFSKLASNPTPKEAPVPTAPAKVAPKLSLPKAPIANVIPYEAATTANGSLLRRRGGHRADNIGASDCPGFTSILPSWGLNSTTTYSSIVASMASMPLRSDVVWTDIAFRFLVSAAQHQGLIAANLTTEGITEEWKARSGVNIAPGPRLLSSVQQAISATSTNLLDDCKRSVLGYIAKPSSVLPTSGISFAHVAACPYCNTSCVTYGDCYALPPLCGVASAPTATVLTNNRPPSEILFLVNRSLKQLNGGTLVEECFADAPSTTNGITPLAPSGLADQTSSTVGSAKVMNVSSNTQKDTNATINTSTAPAPPPTSILIRSSDRKFAAPVTTAVPSISINGEEGTQPIGRMAARMLQRGQRRDREEEGEAVGEAENKYDDATRNQRSPADDRVVASNRVSMIVSSPESGDEHSPHKVLNTHPTASSANVSLMDITIGDLSAIDRSVTGGQSFFMASGACTPTTADAANGKSFEDYVGGQVIIKKPSGELLSAAQTPLLKSILKPSSIVRASAPEIPKQSDNDTSASGGIDASAIFHTTSTKNHRASAANTDMSVIQDSSMLDGLRSFLAMPAAPTTNVHHEAAVAKPQPSDGVLKRRRMEESAVLMDTTTSSSPSAIDASKQLSEKESNTTFLAQSKGGNQNASISIGHLSGIPTAKNSLSANGSSSAMNMPAQHQSSINPPSTSRSVNQSSVPEKPPLGITYDQLTLPSTRAGVGSYFNQKQPTKATAPLLASQQPVTAPVRLPIKSQVRSDDSAAEDDIPTCYPTILEQSLTVLVLGSPMHSDFSDRQSNTSKTKASNEPPISFLAALKTGKAFKRPQRGEVPLTQMVTELFLSEARKAGPVPQLSCLSAPSITLLCDTVLRIDGGGAATSLGRALALRCTSYLMDAAAVASATSSVLFANGSNTMLIGEQQQQSVPSAAPVLVSAVVEGVEGLLRNKDSTDIRDMLTALRVHNVFEGLGALFAQMQCLRKDTEAPEPSSPSSNYPDAASIVSAPSVPSVAGVLLFISCPSAIDSLSLTQAATTLYQELWEVSLSHDDGKATSSIPHPPLVIVPVDSTTAEVIGAPAAEVFALCAVSGLRSLLATIAS